MSETIKITNRRRSERRTDPLRVARALDDLCNSLKPGDSIPTHTELMRQFDASERSVLRALDELQRSGRVIRRNGVGTFVAETGSNSPSLAPSVVDNRTVVAITQPDSSFFDRCMDLLFRHVEAANLTLVCRMIGTDVQANFVSPPAISGPMGFVVFRYDLSPLAKRLQDSGHRVVLFGAPPFDETPQVPCIHGDHELGAHLIASHLIELGHRRLCFVIPGETSLHSMRWLGHQRAVREAQRAGLDVTSIVLEAEIAQSWEQDPQKAAEYLRRDDAPTGLVIWNDHEAARLMSVLARAGVRVPEEVSVAGYDNLPEGTLVYPPLTTVDHAIGRQLHAALSLLMRPSPPPPSHTVVLVPTLIARGSTSAPRS